jgi:hypothetical protein
MTNDPEVRCFVLDYLRHGPAKLDDVYLAAWSQFAFTREQVIAAMDALAVRCKTIDGARLVMAPPNLHAIWWARPNVAHRFRHQATGGNAA